MPASGTFLDTRLRHHACQLQFSRGRCCTTTTTEMTDPFQVVVTSSFFGGPDARETASHCCCTSNGQKVGQNDLMPLSCAPIRTQHKNASRTFGTSHCVITFYKRRGEKVPQSPKYIKHKQINTRTIKTTQNITDPSVYGIIKIL